MCLGCVTCTLHYPTLGFSFGLRFHCFPKFYIYFHTLGFVLLQSQGYLDIANGFDVASLRSEAVYLHVRAIYRHVIVAYPYRLLWVRYPATIRRAKYAYNSLALMIATTTNILCLTFQLPKIKYGSDYLSRNIVKGWQSVRREFDHLHWTSDFQAQLVRRKRATVIPNYMKYFTTIKHTFMTECFCEDFKPHLFVPRRAVK